MIRSELAVCKRMGWTYQALMATPVSVVVVLVDMVHEMSEAASD